MKPFSCQFSKRSNFLHPKHFNVVKLFEIQVAVIITHTPFKFFFLPKCTCTVSHFLTSIFTSIFDAAPNLIALHSPIKKWTAFGNKTSSQFCCNKKKRISFWHNQLQPISEWLRGKKISLLVHSISLWKWNFAIKRWCPYCRYRNHRTWQLTFV